LTPTEITTAWHAGATGVKVFPSMALGGSEYIRHLQGPLGHIPLIPTGGVTLQNAGALIAAGAIAVGLGGDLMPQSAVSQQNWLEITQRMQHVLRSLPTQVVH
ncbi:MAG TPA: ketohydroxyglutarate aldolase, partial [Stenomitos sp.]